jgi:hypothetical protein
MEKLDIYLEHRGEMQTGDLLLWKSRSIIGALIRFFSRGDFNHAGLVLKLEEFANLKDRRWTLEAMESGIVLHLLSRRLQAYDGEIWWYPLKDMFDYCRDDIGSWSIEKVGTPYDYGSLFKNALGRVSADAKSFFCSEYAFMAYRDNGIPVDFDKAPRPADMPLLDIFGPPVKLF